MSTPSNIVVTTEEDLAFEIDTVQTWRILCALEPHLNELSFEDNCGRFLIIEANDPKMRWAIMTADMVAQRYNHIEPVQNQMKLVRLIKVVD